MDLTTRTRPIAKLRQHGILPPVAVVAPRATHWKPHDDLVPFLLADWQSALRHAFTRAQRHRAQSAVTWLEQQAQQRAQITWGVPGPLGPRVAQWIGWRLIWWPRGIPPGEWVALVSSRLGRPAEKHRSWFAALRSVCAGLDPSQSVLVSSPKTTTHAYLERCSELFRLPMLRFDLPAAGQSTTTWFQIQHRALARRLTGSEWVWPAVVSPALSAELDDSSPLRDRLVLAASDHVIALRLRSGGHISRLVRRWLDEHVLLTAPRLSLAVGAYLVPHELAGALESRGARRLTGRPECNVEQAPTGTAAEAGAPSRGTVLSWDAVPASGYLTHCTRPTQGPWPDQGEADYLDALIMAREDSDHGVLATLARIASEQRLRASAKAIRGATPVVCFTAVPLRDMAPLHCFRAHRGRWDFSPYGMCLAQSWLEARGARPVQYGEASLWERLGESQRPFYQLCRSGQHSQFDWSREREWRHVGDVDLTQLPADAAWLFVPTVEEAHWLAARSRWPVVAVPGRQ